MPVAGSDSLPGALVSRWREAERRLYPLVLSSPERYEQSVRLARAVADGLRTVSRPEELAGRFEQRRQLLAQAATGLGLVLDEIDRDAVTGAAFALRHAELETEARRAVALERLARARREHRAWATLYESGARTATGVIPPYHLVEACLARPWGVHASAVFDVEANAVVYLVEAVHVDHESAQWWAGDSPPVAERACTDVGSWRAALAELRKELART